MTGYETVPLDHLGTPRCLDATTAAARPPLCCGALPGVTRCDAAAG
jgi:hypothetical protein